MNRQYTEITSPEQRRRYKSEFATQYEEYLIIHSRMQAVSDRFTLLEERLHGEPNGSPNHRVSFFLFDYYEYYAVN